MAASATFALKAGVWFRRGRLLIISPVQQPFLALVRQKSHLSGCPDSPGHLCRTVSREVAHTVRRKRMRAFPIVVLIVNDPTTMCRASSRVEVEAHRLQDGDHGLRQMGSSEHIAAEVEQQILWFRRRRR